MMLSAISGTDIALLAGITYVVLLWVALAFYVVRDARGRSLSWAFQLLAVILGFVPPFFGFLVYLMIRPPHTIEEERTLALEEQALTEVDDESQPRPCPNCGRDIEPDFVICPYCRAQFARRCANCSRHLRLGWAVCPYCAEELGVHPLSRATRTAGH